MSAMAIFAIIGWGSAGLFFANANIWRDRCRTARELNGQLAARVIELGAGKSIPVEGLPDGPLKRAIQKAYETGETVIWNEGDPLP